MSRYARFTAFPQLVGVENMIDPDPRGLAGAGDVAGTAASTTPGEGTR
jgi:hypothetical protein